MLVVKETCNLVGIVNLPCMVNTQRFDGYKGGSLSSLVASTRMKQSQRDSVLGVEDVGNQGKENVCNIT